jgi:hypothetical protein
VEELIHLDLEVPVVEQQQPQQQIQPPVEPQIQEVEVLELEEIVQGEVEVPVVPV